MSQLKLLNNKVIGENNKPYFIAEVNSSHNGNIETAKKMIDSIKECGCDCVKFQSWSPESLYSKTYYDKNPISKRIVQKFSIKPEDLLELANYCHCIGLDFSSTPYSKEEVDFLVGKCKAPFVKIASMEINNFDFLDYIARKNVPMILSTGMSDIDEVKKAVEVIEKTGNKQLAILHCISIYPAEIKTINLKNIITLKKLYPNYPIGFSDHTLGYEVACGAVALGSAIIEKHFTLDKTKMGMDNNMAIEPDEMSALVKSFINVYEAMGTEDRIVLDVEKEQRLKMRRSIIATKDLKVGDIIKKEDLDAKRPGDGIPPNKIYEIIGKKLKRDVEKDSLIYLEDIV